MLVSISETMFNIVGAGFDKGTHIFAVINGEGYNLHYNRNKKLNKHPDYVISKAKEREN